MIFPGKVSLAQTEAQARGKTQHQTMGGAQVKAKRAKEVRSKHPNNQNENILIERVSSHDTSHRSNIPGTLVDLSTKATHLVDAFL